MKKILPLSVFVILLLTGCKSSELVDPTTTIKYSVPVQSHVKLYVENSYNTVVKTLVDQLQPAGQYNAQFDSVNLAEGVYFYTLEMTGDGNNFYSKITRTVLLGK